MSFRSLLGERVVSWIPRNVTSTDAHGNDVTVDGTPVAGIPAARDPLALEEDTGDARDQQIRRYVYFLPPDHEGTEIRPTGHDVILDGDDRFEIRGTPDLVVRRRGGKVHHVEAIAEIEE